MKKKFIIFVLLIGAFVKVFSAETKGEIGNLKWLIRDGELSIVGSTETKNDVISIDIPEVIDGKNVTKIFRDAFKNCKNLVEVKLPKTIKIIDQGAFQNCVSLTEIILPENLENIGQYAFQNCSFTEIVIPSSVKNIGRNSFSGCSKLLEIKINDAPVSIDNDAFSGISSLVSLDLGNKITSIGNKAFGYYNLEKFIMPDSVKFLGDSVFERSENLKEVIL